MHKVKRGRHIGSSCAVILTLIWGIPAPSVAQEAVRGQLQITTYNTHHGTGNDACDPPSATAPPQTDCGFNLDRLISTIRAFDSDVVALQEVDRFWARSGSTDQPAVLGKALGMVTCYGANLDHQPDMHAAVPHQYGTLILSRHPIASCRNTRLPQPDGTETRGLLEAVVSVDNTSIRIFNTHLHTTNPARTLQVQAILALIGTPAEPLVLVGDFNALPTATEMGPLYERFDDAWARAGQGPGFTYPAAPKSEPNRRIDYAFVSRGTLDLLSAAVTLNDDTRMTADHLPVTIVVRWRTR